MNGLPASRTNSNIQPQGPWAITASVHNKLFWNYIIPNVRISACARMWTQKLCIYSGLRNAYSYKQLAILIECHSFNLQVFRQTDRQTSATKEMMPPWCKCKVTIKWLIYITCTVACSLPSMCAKETWCKNFELGCSLTLHAIT